MRPAHLQDATRNVRRSQLLGHLATLDTMMVKEDVPPSVTPWLVRVVLRSPYQEAVRSQHYYV
eukprot:5975879-Karenia_brevis.AAC.1